MWRQRQAGRMHAGFALEQHAAMPCLLGIHTHRGHLKKLETFSVSEVEDGPYHECDPPEECFRICRGESRALWKYTLPTTASSSGHVPITTVQWSICCHLDFRSLVPPPPLCVCSHTCLVTCGQLTVAFRSSILFILHSVCNLSQKCCVGAALCPRRWYFLHNLYTKSWNHVKVCLLSSDLSASYFQEPSWLWYSGLTIIQLCFISKTSREAEFFTLPLQLFKLIKQIRVVSC